MEKLYLRVEYTFKKGLREAFLNEIEARGIVPLIRYEKGCIEYSYFLSVDNSDTLLLLETWENEFLQQKHLEAPHMEMLAKLKERYVEDTKVFKFIMKED